MKEKRKKWSQRDCSLPIKSETLLHNPIIHIKKKMKVCKSVLYSRKLWLGKVQSSLSVYYSLFWYARIFYSTTDDHPGSRLGAGFEVINQRTSTIFFFFKLIRFNFKIYHVKINALDIIYSHPFTCAGNNLISMNLKNMVQAIWWSHSKFRFYVFQICQ